MGKDKSNSITEVALELQLSVAEGKNQKLEEEKVALQSQVETLSKTIDGQQDRIEELAAEKEQLNKRIKALESEKKDLEKQIVKLEQKKIDPAKLQELQNTIRSKQGEINNLNAQRDGLYREKKELSSEKNALEQEKKTWASEKAALEQEKEKLESKLQDFPKESISLKSSYRRMLFTALIALLVGAGVAFSTAFTIQRWWQWQHVIGALGGLLLFGATFFYWIFYAKDDLYIKGGIVFAALLAINTLLILFFKSAYVTVSFWMSGYLIAVSVLAAYCAFKDDEPVVGTILVIDAVLSILSIVLMAVFSAKLTDIKWWQWEHVIGALFGVLLLNFEYFLGYTADDGFYKIECAVLSVLLVINAILTPILLVPYQIVSFWVSGCLIAVSALMAYVDFVDDEPLFGGILVGEGVLSIVSIVLTAVLI